MHGEGEGGRGGGLKQEDRKRGIEWKFTQCQGKGKGYYRLVWKGGGGEGGMRREANKKVCNTCAPRQYHLIEIPLQTP